MQKSLLRLSGWENKVVQATAISGRFAGPLSQYFLWYVFTNYIQIIKYIQIQWDTSTWLTYYCTLAPLWLIALFLRECERWSNMIQVLATSSNQDLEDAPVVAAPSEEEVALAWRPKDTSSRVAAVSCTVDGRNPAPVNPIIPLFTGFYTSKRSLFEISEPSTCCVWVVISSMLHPAAKASHHGHFSFQESASGSSCSESFVSRGHGSLVMCMNSTNIPNAPCMV